MRFINWISAWFLFLWQEKWPWMRKVRHDTVVEMYRARLREANEEPRRLGEIAHRLTEELARAHEAMQAAGRKDPVYAMLVERLLSVDLYQDPSGGIYSIRVAFDARAPYLFGNDDRAAWECYADVVCRKVHAELMNSKFVQRPSPHLSRPLGREAKA